MTAIEIINQIEEDKKRRGIEPHHALLHEINRVAGQEHWDSVRNELEGLQRDKKIQVGDTINSQYIKIL